MAQGKGLKLEAGFQMTHIAWEINFARVNVKITLLLHLRKISSPGPNGY